MTDAEDLEENYRRAYGNRIGFGKKPALIMIDLVRAYFDPDCELYADVDDTLASAVRLRDAAREAGVPVIYTNVVYLPDGSNGGRFFQKARPLRNFTAGNPMARWADGLEVGEGELVISKQYASAFFGTSLAPTLTSWGIDTLVHTGVSTSGCVRATCVDCCSYGFIPIIAREAVGDRHHAPHEANLFDMDAKYGDVVGEKDVLDYFKSIGEPA
ncbi:isochorismatase family protein [Hoeflea prorocentri]|uniref:Isochorismatase family protein n=1 Tax=Hoeflea prorocentri TaxID=1922333 RepID=A0A9X3UM03_9HYPH|nr:isochorismatase family protein [Hoeflea prorocentri]MCY6383703.1 isochorismatase family protein [Hoeflea prorocentri]MDA5401503.1 isochorismatase family protein [Hoeflea prorocentri]